MWVIDDDSFLSQLETDKVFVEIIPFNNQIHPKLNKISCIFIRPYSKNEGYLVPISHNEARSLTIKGVCAYMNRIQTIHVRNKKLFNHFFGNISNVVDLSLTHHIEVDDIPLVNFYKQQHKNLIYVNCIIPLSKLYENCENIFQHIKDIIPKSTFYDKAPYIFQQIEKNGLKINDKFAMFFNINKEFSTKNDIIYTQYNLYTLTRRPSNAFNGINFAALSKDNGCRKSFIPQNDYFVEIDISAYHPTLIAKLVGYNFKGEDVYEHFSKLFNKDRQHTKKLLLTQLYGGIKPEYLQLEYFFKTQQYINQKWDEFQQAGKTICKSGHEFIGNKLENMNPNKLFNYILQELETYNNLFILDNILKILEDKQSKLVLYTYDSFTLDIKDEEKWLVGEIENLFKEQQLKIKTTQKLCL